MTERKPSGVGFETWVERQIREATERGEFDNLPGAGKPIADLDEPHDELWWVKRKLRRENLSYLPPTMVLRKDAEDALAAASRAASEAEVRRIVADINTRIVEGNRKAAAGPPLNLMPFDVERVVAAWRKRDRGHPLPRRRGRSLSTSSAPPNSPTFL
jgi:DnaJ-like protein